MNKITHLQMAVLTVNNETFPIYEGVNTIGRNKDAIVNVKHMNISQNHAIIVIIDGQHYISDLNSSNGSFCDDSKMIAFKLYELKENSEVILGGLLGRYSFKGPFTEVEDKSTHDNLLPSQSFYGRDTQIMDDSTAQNSDIHDAPTQEMSWAFAKPRRAPPQKRPQIIVDNSYPINLSDEFNDEHLPLLENSNNVPNVEEGEELTEIITEFRKSPPVLEDESTDCEDNEVEEQNCTTVPEGDVDSNDSVDFLKANESANKYHSDSNTDEDFSFKRTRKSFMVISSQDMDSHFDKSIPATQNESASDFDDSDFVPATPRVQAKSIQRVLSEDAVAPLDDGVFMPADSEKSNKAKNAGGWSEDSFKLGLTELMTESSQDANEIRKSSLPDIFEEHAGDDDKNQPKDDAFLAPTQKCDAPTQKDVADNHGAREASVTISFSAPTQKLDPKMSSMDIYDAPTQKMPSCHEGKNQLTAPTQKIDREIYDAPTQEVLADNHGAREASGTISFSAPTQKLDPKMSSMDIYDAPTQKMDREIPDIYDAPTQKVLADNHGARESLGSNFWVGAENEAFSAPTQKLDPKMSSIDIYEAPTQKVFTNSTDDIYLEPTQKIDPKLGKIEEENIYDAPTQEVQPNTKLIKPTIEVASKEESMPERAESPSDYKAPKKKKSAAQSQADENKAAAADSNVDENIATTINPLDNLTLADTEEEAESSSKDQKGHKEQNTSNSLATIDIKVDGPTPTLNKSFALLESKMTKTRKSKQTAEITVTVPRNRRSMSISHIEESPKPITTRPTRQSSKREIPKPSASAKKKNPETIVKRSSRRNQKTGSINNNIIEEANNTIQSDSDSASTSSSSKIKARGKGNGYNVSEASSSSSTKSIASGKRKITLTSSESDLSVTSATTSPKKAKLESAEVKFSSPQRGLRKQRPKVVFTMIDSPQLESLVKQLGGSMVDTVDSSTVLVTERVKRSQKLLSAIGLGKPICSPKWITDSKKAQEFLDPWDYILTDPEAEKKWNFSLKESLNRSKTSKLLKSYSFHIQVTNGVDVLKGAIESCGGKCLTKIPKTPIENAYIISSRKDPAKYKRLIKQSPYLKVIEAEAVFEGVLRQELRFSLHILN